MSISERRRLLHLSDLHLNARNEMRYGVDPDASLRAVLATCAELDAVIAVVVTGDIADDGSEPAYARARDLILEYACSRAARVMFCVGNHDDRQAFTNVLGTGHLDPEGNDCGEMSSGGRVAAVSDLGGLRVITLDSLVSGRWYGRLGSAQLSWLRSVVSAGPSPAMVALHHPPIDLGMEIQQRVGLEDREAFASSLKHMQVGAILCGHFHQQISGFLSGIPTWVTPGIFTRIDHLSGPAGTERALAGGSATVIDVTEPMSSVFSTLPARDPRAGQSAYEITLDELNEDLARFALPVQAT
jgi:3',5'-cyclic-AMP phosphodiesterase